MQNLKDYRDKELKYYAIANSLVMLLFAGNPSSPFLFRHWEYWVAGNELDKWTAVLANLIGIGIGSSIVYVYTFLLDSLIPSDMKYKICYLYFWKQPGYTIFSKIRNGIVDMRFTKEYALKKYCDVYNKIDKIEGNFDKQIYENAAWYRIYDKYKSDGMVFHANRDYLLCRDLCVMSLTVLVLYLISCAFGVTCFLGSVFCFIVLEFVVTDIAVWMKGKRLAFHVLTLDIYGKKE